MFNQSY
jgi:hypothetical protein